MGSHFDFCARKTLFLEFRKYVLSLIGDLSKLLELILRHLTRFYEILSEFLWTTVEILRHINAFHAHDCRYRIRCKLTKLAKPSHRVRNKSRKLKRLRKKITQ